MAGGQSGRRQRLLDQGRHDGHVGAAGQFRLDDGHDLAHVLRTGGARRSHGGGDFGGDFRLRQPGRHVGDQHGQLGFFDVARSARPPASNWVIESLRCLIIFSTMATVWASLTSMRSSTSLRLISAISRRIVLSLPVSLARIAAFMSSVTCSLRPMAVSPSISCDIKTKTRCGEPERACDSYGYYYP